MCLQDNKRNTNKYLSLATSGFGIFFSSSQSFNTLHMMYHEATACHVTGDLVELLSIFLSVLKSTRPYLQRKGLIVTLERFMPLVSKVIFLTQTLVFLSWLMAVFKNLVYSRICGC